MGPPPSMKNLFWYLENSLKKPLGIRNQSWYPENSSEELQIIEPHVDNYLPLPWNKDTIMFVVSYVFQFIANLEYSEFSDAIMALDEKAKRVYDYDATTRMREGREVEMSRMLVNSFFPDVVRRFFTVPKLHQLPKSDKHLCLNETIAGFMDFLLQVLFHETNSSEDQVQRWALVRKELSFLLALLGDIPFQCTHHGLVGQVTNILAEFEMLANDAGGFVYDGVFSIHQMEANRFHAKTIAWFEKVQLLNAKIKEHCLKFSELPMSLISRSSVVDSFFIIYSLIEDIENLKNQRLDFDHGDDIMEQMKTLLGELTLSQSFIEVMQDNEEKEGLIVIRDLAYEAEYLINSLVVGNILVWYINLRLPSIIHKIKLACVGLQQIAESKLMNASDRKVSSPTTENTATMDENHFLEFNVDAAQRILNDQSDYMKIFELGYKHLPCNIKPCFLYFAGIPKDYEISKEKLIRLWISEGFIPRQGNKSIEETAEMYLLDLINRKLVLIAERGSNGGIKRCRIQSLLHDFIERKANEENFVKFTNGFSMYEKCQRLCLASTSCNYWRPFGLHCRSYRDLRTRQNSTCFQTMALLKVVDQESPEHYISSPHPTLAFPAQLRYLGVRHLSDKMVTNLVNLESIFVNVINEDTVCVPPVVLRMVKLRHVVVKWRAEFGEDCCINMAETTNLRTLSSVRIIEKKDEGILRCCPHLHKLKCFFREFTKFPDVSFLAELESLSMFFHNGFTPEILSAKINFPSTIKKLRLEDSYLPWEMMSILGRLPNLEVLKLGWDAFTGDVWETRDGEFQKLRCLKLYKSRNLRLWISCSEHFPVLKFLVLRLCHELVEIPSDFANIPTLERLQVKHCSDKACLSALLIKKQAQFQVDIDSCSQKEDELMLKVTNPSRDDLMNMLSCMEEYFEAGGCQGFINKLTILDQTEDKTTGHEDEDEGEAAFMIKEDGVAFVLKDVLNYMEEYFEAEGSEESIKKLAVIDQTEDQTTTTGNADGNDEPLVFVNQQTYLIVVSYAMQFSKNLENIAFSDIILGLRCAAASYNNIKQFLPGHPIYLDEIKKSKREFSDRLVSSFLPQVQIFFEVPKIEQLPDNGNKPLKKNEILAGFMDFLLQVMFCKVNSGSAEVDQYGLLQKELLFLLAVLGDTPFLPSKHPDLDEQVNNILAEFEIFANKAGGFLFYCVFPIQPIKTSRLCEETKFLLEMGELLNAKIKDHCSNFSKLPVCVTVRPNVVDSFFIVDSLIGDLQGVIKNGQLGNFTPDDAIKDHMKTLHDELTVLSQSFIKVVRDTDHNEIKEGLIQIRDLTYEAEYLINSLVAGNIDMWYLNLRLPSIVCKIKIARIGLQQISKAKVTKACDGIVSIPTIGNTATIGDNQFLDFNQEFTQRILNDLTGNLNTSQKVITIFGMPGLGKTTTTTKLYNGKATLNHFDRRAWCVVSEKYNVRALFIQILLDLANEPGNSSISEETADSKLGEEIHKTLKGRRYLIVVDDVWDSDVLDKLRLYFPDDSNGSRIVITTRNRDVSPSGSTIYELPILSEHQCWNLLEKKVFPKDQCPSDLLTVGKRIAARCSGVPLAVVSIAGILVNLEKQECEWKRVEERMDTILLDDQSNYRKIMELSYENLPHNIKPCFLYFARFPEDAEISTKELKLFWITQGFVQNDGNKSSEEIAEIYLLDLVNRSLVMTAKRRSDGGMKTCRIHDLLHDICIKKADEENFLNPTNLYSTFDKHQHLCHQSSSNLNWRPFSLHCRSFRGQLDQLSGFRTMALIKFADLFPKENYSLYDPQGVDLPCQLRYLGISTELPTGILVDNILNLEVLHIRGGGVKVVLPSVILRMEKLRHLVVRGWAVFEEDCSKISETTNLRSISHIVIENKRDEEILRKSPHLQTLKCKCRGETIFPDLSSHAELESLGMNFENSICDVESIKFPLTIRKLCLNNSGLPWEKMSIIGELPKLQVLKLEYNAFKGEEWETKDDQFQELRFLQIYSTDLKHWSTESSHFPSLEQLVVSECKYLVEIPCDLGSIPTLLRIEVSNCSKEVSLSAIEIEREQREYANQELQVDIIHREWTKEELMRENTDIE